MSSIIPTDDFLDDEERDIVTRYEAMLASRADAYFDMAELEVVIDYYSEHFELQKAMKAVALAERLHAQSPALELCKAIIYAFEDKPRRALKLIAQLEAMPDVKGEINSFRLRLIKMYSLMLLDRLDEALEIQHDLMTSEVEDHDDMEHVLSIATSAMFHRGHIAEALANMLPFEVMYKFSPYMLCNVAYAYGEMGDTANAIAYYRKAINGDAFDPGIWCDLADLLTDFDEAAQAYDYAIALDDEFADAYIGKAELYMEADKKAEAIELLMHAIEACGRIPELYCLLAECKADLGDFEAALHYYNDIVQDDPFYPEIWFAMADAYLEINMNEEALDACEKALAIESEPTSDEYGLAAAVYLANGMKEQELEMLEKMHEQIEAEGNYD